METGKHIKTIDIVTINQYIIYVFRFLKLSQNLFLSSKLSQKRFFGELRPLSSNMTVYYRLVCNNGGFVLMEFENFENL